MSTNKLDNQPVDSLSSWNPSVAGSDVSGEERSIGVSYSETGESGLPQVLNQHNYLETHRSGHLFPKDSSLPRRPHSPYNSNGPIKNLNIEMSYLRHGPPPPSDVDPQFDDRPFTVDREEKNKSAHKYRRKKPILLSILKCIVSLIMSAGLITCVIVSKLSLVTVGQKLNFTLWKSNNENNRTSNASIKASTLSINNASNQYQSAIVFNMLVLILIVPHAYGFLRSLFSSGFKQSHPWPTKRAVLWGFIGSFCESAGLSLFVFGCLSILKEADVAVVLMNAVFVVPVVWQMSKACVERFTPDEARSSHVPKDVIRQHKRKHMRNMILAFLAIISQVGGLVGIVYLAGGKDGSKLMVLRFILVPISVILLSFAWCPKVKKLQIDHDLEFVTEVGEEEDEKFSRYGTQNSALDYKTKTGSITSVDTVSSTGKSKSKLIQQGSWASDPDKVIVETNTARGKATLVNSLLKVIFVPLCSSAIVFAMKLVDLTQIGYGFKYFTTDNTLLIHFCVQISTSFLGYHLAWLACTTTIQRFSFALPLTLSTPLTIILLVTNRCTSPYMNFIQCHSTQHSYYMLLLSAALWFGQFFATTYYAWKSQDFIMAGEAVLFWTPSYEGAMLEQNLLLNRKNEATNEYFVNYRDLVANSSIYMCTTMYHEEAFEMEQLLNSVAGLDAARKEAGRKMEAHIFFDDGVRDKVPKKYALQLVSLLEKTLDVSASSAKKIDTPYGVQLKWKLPGGMLFYIHLKDNYKVKNKKRWSQVMYMSYVLDFREIGKHENAYILTTDADVRFSPDDVMALMDRMSRDPRVGAVCGRTHPMGSGPLVWYQVFDYAIGHWLLKVAEDVLGSVLCSPGCFSIYRASAIHDVLPTYASHVECALDFLTKDMGEDRWFCTLLVEHGWRLEYCAAAKNSTYCPDSFNEFFKQRRRWTPSTIANQVVLIQKASEIRKNNDHITVWFIFYQVLLMISTVVGPANVIFVISSGLSYAYPAVSMHGMFGFVTFTVAAYVAICLYFPQDFQLKVAQWLTFIYAIIMTITFVGLMAGIADDIIKNTPSDTPKNVTTVQPTFVNNTIINKVTYTLVTPSFSLWKLAPSNIYLLFLTILFISTAFLHGTEGFSVVHGIWFLLCLPAGYLFLMIYSVANMTDRSWGTREAKSAVSAGGRDPWKMLKNLWSKTKICCWNTCKKRRRKSSRDEEDVDMSDLTSEGTGAMTEAVGEDLGTLEDMETSENVAEAQNEQQTEATSPSKVPRGLSRSKTRKFLSRIGSKRQRDGLVSGVSRRDRDSPGVRFKIFGYDENEVVQGIEEWLNGRYEMYIENFKDHGYDDTTFLIGMKEQDLLDIGVSNRGHRRKLLREIERLPPEEMDCNVPDDVYDWLIRLGLETYWIRFQENSYTEPNSLADLKFMDEQTVQHTFQLSKKGHVKKLMKGIKFLQYPSSAQRKIQKARADLEERPLLNLQGESKAEFRFWRRLRESCLLPEQAAFSSSDELKGKLEELRNSSLLMLGVTNIIWMTLTLTIMEQGKKLTILGTNFLGLFFLFIFTLVMIVQFITLLIHRVGTWIHLISRIPLIPGAKAKLGWSFSDEDLPPTPAHADMFEAQWKIHEQVMNPSRRKKSIRRLDSRFRSVPAQSQFSS